MNRPVLYHGSIALVGLAIAATGVDTLLDPDISDLAGAVAVVGGGILCATSGHTLATGTTSEVSEGATWLVVLAAALSIVGLVVTFLG